MVGELDVDVVVADVNTVAGFEVDYGTVDVSVVNVDVDSVVVVDSNVDV